MTTYLGFDESSLSIGNGGLVIAAAETTNSYLAQDIGDGSLQKSRDLIKNNEEFPSPYEMITAGVDKFLWLRVRSGRFNRQNIQHAAISHLVLQGDYESDDTVLLIDAYDDQYKIIDSITQLLHTNDFLIPQKNIEVHPGGDKSVPLINYADLFAFQIVESRERAYEQFASELYLPNIGSDHEVVESFRTEPLEGTMRDGLEKMLKVA
jgi:hypothetical protein